MDELTFKKKRIKFSRTPSGIPVFWEKSKKFEDITRVTVLFTPEGDTKESIFNRIGTSDSLIPIKDGDIIVKIFFETNGIGISVLRLINIDKYSKYAEVEVIRRKSPTSSEWVYNKDADSLGQIPYDKITSAINKIIKNTQ
jgi:hypothetical protein